MARYRSRSWRSWSTNGSPGAVDAGAALRRADARGRESRVFCPPRRRLAGLGWDHCIAGDRPMCDTGYSITRLVAALKDLKERPAPEKDNLQVVPALPHRMDRYNHNWLPPSTGSP